MGIEIVCPKCGVKSKGKDELAGKTVRCPKCKELFTIPQAEIQFDIVEEVATVPDNAPPSMPVVEKPAPSLQPTPTRESQSMAPLSVPTAAKKISWLASWTASDEEIVEYVKTKGGSGKVAESICHVASASSVFVLGFMAFYANNEIKHKLDSLRGEMRTLDSAWERQYGATFDGVSGFIVLYAWVMIALGLVFASTAISAFHDHMTMKKLSRGWKR